MTDERKPPLTPQEKKALSLKKDCRNTYGENAKASRKAIPVRKAGENRKARRKTGQQLHVLPTVEEGVAERIESDASHDIERVGGWVKGPDVPLADWIERQVGWREIRTGRKGRSRAARQDE